MSDRPLSERVVLVHADECPHGDDCNCGAKEERAEIAALEQQLREKGDLAVQRRGECILLEQERNRLRNGLVGIPCSCVKAGSSDGTTTVMRKCRRCTALGGDDE
jgi:hypothetical protein